MIPILNYNSFLEEKIVNETISFIESSVNESVDAKGLFHSTIRKIKNISDGSKKKVLSHLFASLLAISSYNTIHNMIDKSNISSDLKDISISALNTCVNDKDISKNIEMDYDIKWKRGYDFKLSQSGWDHIRSEESLRLKAYSIGDGMITVGWGHAEPKSKSKYKIGQVITKEEADVLLRDDLKVAADGVRRIFREWEERGIDVKITQEMFDALVSIAYNTGIGNLRKSDIIQHIKRGEYEIAGEKIRSFKVSKKFPGLYDRREKESQMFLASL